MLHENIRTIRREKGLSQEELACRLNIVRQTVSKWEQGLSVPDAEMLVQLAGVLEVPVSTLLGETDEPVMEINQIDELLSRLNAQLAEKDNRSRRRWRMIKGLLIALLMVTFLVLVLSAAA